MEFNHPIDVFKYLLDIDETRLDQNLDDYLENTHEMYEHVKKLIKAHHQNQEQTIGRKVLSSSVEAMSQDSILNDLKGEQFGPYSLSELIGSGGMGVVYAADRNDGRLEQSVAIKILFPSILDLSSNKSESSEPIFAEAQYLASLRHPNIATVLDVNTYFVDSDSPLSYMVMEHITGIPIDKYCKTNAISQKKRLRLFLKVLKAVAFAHANMVIHADLKPSNILIDANDEPKLLDFGIARNSFIADAEVDNINQSLIKNASTTKYASPEQQLGANLTIQTDVFSIAITLKEVLSDLPNNPELDAVIYAATRNELSERVTDINTLISNIEAYLSERVVQLYKSGWQYTYQKWLQRSPVSAIGVFGVPILLAIASLSIYWKNQALAQEVFKNHQVLNYYQDLFESTSPNMARNQDLSAADLLRVGIENVDEISITDEQTRSRVQLTLATSLFNLGLLQEALSTLESIPSSPNTNNLESLLLKASIHLAQESIDEAISTVEKIKSLTIDEPQKDSRISHQVLLLDMSTHALRAKGIAGIETEAAALTMAKLEDMISEAKTLESVPEQSINRLKSTVKSTFSILDNVLFTKNRQLNFDLSSSIQELDSYIKDSQSEFSAWKQLAISLSALQKGDDSLAQSSLDSAILDAEASLNAFHPELAEIYGLAIPIYKRLNEQLSLERMFFKQQAIFEHLSPNFDVRLIKNFALQVEYFKQANLRAQARSANLKSIKLCGQTFSEYCKEQLIESIKLAYAMSDYEYVIQQSEEIFDKHIDLVNFELKSLLLGARNSLGYSKSEIDWKHLQSLADSDAQKAHLVELRISAGEAQKVIEVYEKSNREAYSALENIAIASAYESLGQKTESARVLAGVFGESSMNSAAAFVKTIRENIGQFDIHRKESELFSILDGNHIKLRNRRVDAISFPSDDIVATIGENLSIIWDNTSLLGNTVSVFINHKRVFDPEGFNHWQKVQNVNWHLSGQNIINSGEMKIDPFYFMTNGSSNKVLLVSDLGYWSISDGLFTVRSGQIKDNGLEHDLDPLLLVDVIDIPNAGHIYKVGRESEILWNADRIGGGNVAIYILHDNPDNLGSKNDVNAALMRQRRWFLVSRSVSNKGIHKLDPAQFAGQGSNYKLLIVSDNGNWAVSDDRFTVLNPF